jgi:hypothetical protein
MYIGICVFVIQPLNMKAPWYLPKSAEIIYLISLKEKREEIEKNAVLFKGFLEILWRLKKSAGLVVLLLLS